MLLQSVPGAMLAWGFGDLAKLTADVQDRIGTLLLNLASTWTAYQIVVILGCGLLSRWLGRRLTPPLEEQLRRIRRQPGLLRVLVTVLRRLDWILFALLLNLAALVLAQLTWPSHSYFVRQGATLAAAWASLSTLSRMIRRRAIAMTVAATAWTIAALSVLGLLDKTVGALDAAAVNFGGTKLSLLTAIKAVSLLGVLVWTSSILADIVERHLRNDLAISPTVQVLAGKLIKWLLFSSAVVISLGAVGVDLTTLTMLTGAIGLGIGFGLQKLASNLISGVIILLDRSIKPGDMISIGSTRGQINSLNARYVSVLTPNGAELLIPNETFITEQVTNWSLSDKRMLIDVEFGVHYDSDLLEVRDVALAVVGGLPRVLNEPVPVCHLKAFGDSAVEMVVRFWIEDPEQGIANLRSDVLFGLWKAFGRAGIKIPYPHRELIVRPSDESAIDALRTVAADMRSVVDQRRVKVP